MRRKVRQPEQVCGQTSHARMHLVPEQAQRTQRAPPLGRAAAALELNPEQAVRMCKLAWMCSVRVQAC